MNPKKLTIGRVAKAADVNLQTIRYYQRLDLIAQPPKPHSGYRHYPAETVDRIRFIKRAQALGFTLSEIASLLELGDGCCADVRRVAQAQREQIVTRIDDLRAMQETLDKLIERCYADKNPGHCPLIETLSAKN